MAEAVAAATATAGAKPQTAVHHETRHNEHEQQSKRQKGYITSPTTHPLQLHCLGEHCLVLLTGTITEVVVVVVVVVLVVKIETATFSFFEGMSTAAAAAVYVLQYRYIPYTHAETSTV